MTKDEALKMAIEALEWLSYSERTAKQLEAIDACKEALEQSAQEKINKELLFRTIDGVLDNNLSDGAHFQMTIDAIKKHKKSRNVVGDDYNLAVEYFKGDWR